MKAIYKHLKGKQIDIIGSCLYQGNEFPGVKHGPNTLRNAGLNDLCNKMGWVVNDKGNIEIEKIDLNSIKNEIMKKSLNDYKYKDLVKDAFEIGAMNYKLYHSVKESALAKNFTLILGGDHSLASGSIPALKDVYPKLKVVWIDAHADINTPETSLSVNYHGMPLSHCFGLTEKGTVPGFDWLNANLKFSDIVYIGLRSVDPGEVEFLRKHKIKHYDIDMVTDMGIGKIMKDINQYFEDDVKSKDYPTHISFDIDGVDSQYVKQTGTICRGGLTDREAHYLIRKIVETQNLVSMDLVELNPELGTEEDKKDRVVFHGDMPEIRGSQTTCFSLELVKCALGERLCI